MKRIFLAKPLDLSDGFSDFFATIGLTGTGLVTKGVPAVIAIIGVIMLGKIATHPQQALRRGAMGIGVLFVAAMLAIFGDTLFSTLPGQA
ncbi:hypothetical protein ACFY7N_31045 [Streptomyces albidoflavus]|uniref:hypothetical protein n=1 Tax=Streptomyces TaxID=1883 RepID=UPI0003C2E7FB|nr:MULTISPECIES: hypothetical protein [unclassified Streptomyces]ESQ01821.1 hypothetical protein B590_30098 [Streptomyces sp. PVA_94-07]